MNRIDQKLVMIDDQDLTSAAITEVVLDMIVAKRDRDGGVNAVFHFDMSADTGADDAKTVSCQILSDDNATPTTVVATVFSGTVAQLKAALADKTALRYGLIDSLGSKVKAVCSASAATASKCTVYLEPTL